eukprot:403338826
MKQALLSVLLLTLNSSVSAHFYFRPYQSYCLPSAKELLLNETDGKFQSLIDSCSQDPPNDGIQRGLTDHFMAWLHKNRYEPYNFNRAELGPRASFGGKQDENETISNVPVIFIHGNSDAAVGYNPERGETGWTSSIKYFLEKGYKKSELYTTTYGFIDYWHVGEHHNSPEYVVQIRRFIQAVLKYTGASKVNVIAHSMGVAMTRKALKGGWINNTQDDPLYLGEPLTHKIDVFVGIAGLNHGWTVCQNDTLLEIYNTCSKSFGFYPGDNKTEGMVHHPKLKLSQSLLDINKDPSREAKHVFALVAKNDARVPPIVNGINTSLFPTIDDYLVIDDPAIDHITIKDNTQEIQYHLVRHKKFKQAHKIGNQINQDCDLEAVEL